MGDVADMMLEGQMCQGCGSILGDGDGFPVYCKSCQKENNVDQFGSDKKPTVKKVACPVCGKKVKPAGLEMHQQIVHGGKE